MLAFGVPLRWFRAIQRGFQMSAAHIPMGPLPCVPGQPGPEEAAPDLVLWIWADLGAPWEMMLGSGPSGDLVRCFQM